MLRDHGAANQHGVIASKIIFRQTFGKQKKRRGGGGVVLRNFL